MQNRNTILVKNTIAQYARIIISVIVHLFSARIILQQLGVEDYGIYSVVAGFISFFGILNASMITSVQRYLSYGIANDDTERIRDIYNNSIFIHIMLACVVLILCGTVGVYFIKHYMVFPEGKLQDALIVFQCVIFSFILNIISIPQQAALIAFEKIFLSSIVGIADVILKLFIALSLVLFENKLLSYAIMLAIVALIIRLSYNYIVVHTLNLRFKIKYSVKTIKELLGFAGWNLFGGIANIGKVQGVNVMLNMFMGTAVNAAYGIANQLNSQLLFFSTSVFQASNSQIIQAYGKKDNQRLNFLVCKSSKFAFFFFFLVTLPIFICTDEILYLWLGSIPEYCSVFVKLMLLNSYIELFSTPLMFIMQAYGKIRKYFIIVSLVMLLILPISYVCLKLGMEPQCVLITTICVDIILLLIRILFARYSANYSCKKYIKTVLVPAFMIIIVSILILTIINNVIYANSLIRLMVITLIDIVLVGAMCYFLLFSLEERNAVKLYICQFFSRIKYGK